jgi:ATP/maltotriose-dependent transcriptional regulator MalT/DNA-binding SARP family transcriptional activator
MRTTCLPYLFLPPAPPATPVPRPELWRQLRAGLRPDVRLSVLWGPAGIGKSTAAADYVRDVGLPSLWVTMTPFSQDPALFLSNMLVGLKTAFPSFDPSWAPLLESASYRAASPALTGNLHEALVELAPDGFVLVLDLAGTAPSAPLQVIVALLLDLMPEQGQLIVVADCDQPPSLTAEPVSSLVLGPDVVGMTPSERRRLVSARPGAPEPRDWLDWAWREWLATVGAFADTETLPPPWHLALPMAAHLPWVQPELWQAVVEPLAPWPAAAAWPPVLTRLAGETPIWVPHPAMADHVDVALDEGAKQSLSRRLGVYLAQTDALHAVPAFIAAQDPFQAEALAAPLGEALLGSYHYQALGELLATFPDKHLAASPRLSCLQADLARVSGRADEALGHYADAETHSRARGDGRWVGRALAGQATVWGMRGDERFYKLALAAKEALPAEDQAGRAHVYNLLGIYHWQSNELPLAMTYLEEALKLYGAVHDRMGQGKVLVNLGLCYTKVGKFAKARGIYQEAIACAEDSLKLPIPMVYNNLARIHLLQGEFRAAWEAAERALNLAKQLGARRDVAHAECTLGEINAQRADWAKATLYLDSSLDSARANGDAIAQANALANLAEVAMRQGAWTKARLLLDEAIALRGLPLSDPAVFNFAEAAARLHLELGELKQAEELLVPIHRYMERHGFRYYQTAIEFSLARVHQAKGEVLEAEASFNRACRQAEEHDYPYLKLVEGRAYQERTLIVPAAADAIAEDLHVASFGHFDVRMEGAGLAEAFGRSKKTQQLLVYLMLHRQGLSRDELSELFGHQGDSKSSASLMLISRLRQALEPNLGKHQPSRFILLQDGRYTFNFGLNYAFDAEEFLYLSQRARDPHIKPEEQLASLKQALDLYRGPFLPSCDDEWCLIERERFRLLANEGYLLLFKAFTERGDWAEVLRLADQAIRQDFLNEEAHRAKLIALARLGKREDALKHFKRTDQHLAKKFGLTPSETLVSTFQQILRGQLR